MSAKNQDSKKNSEKLNAILEILRELFILEAAKAGVPKEEIRKILSIDKKRIGRVSKHIKS